MSISILATASGTGAAGGGVTFSYPLTCPAGTDFLVVTYFSPALPSTKAQYNGVDFDTGYEALAYFFGDNWVVLFVMQNPPTGAAYNISFDTTPNPANVWSYAYALKGVNPIDYLDTYVNTGQGSGTDGRPDLPSGGTPHLTLSHDNSMVFSLVVENSTTTANPTLTEKYSATKDYEVNPFSNYKYGLSHKTEPTAGTVDVGWADGAGVSAPYFKGCMLALGLRAAPVSLTSGSFLTQFM